MKIGIITIQKCDNFGADLQAYALGAKLRSLGHDAENIDYLFYKNPRHDKGLGIRDWGLGGRKKRSLEKPVLPLSIVNRLKEKLFPIVDWLRKRRAGDCAPYPRARFKEWEERNIKCGREYRSVASLYADPPRYDVYMVGSDQVWNPRMGSNILPYFLDFAPDGVRCVSYAASFGVSELPAEAYYRFKLLLRRFSAISTREKVGADMVKSMALGVEVKHVIDPTLLLGAEEWAGVSEKVGVRNQKFLLLYDLIPSPETVALAERIATKEGLEVIRIGDGAYGPGEFVWLFAHAAFVVTNSFHGTAFSLNNMKPFYSVIPRGMANASRIESLLASLGLMDRLVRAEDCEKLDFVSGIDYSAVSEKLNDLRQDSIRFLVRSIEGPSVKVQHRLPLGCYAVWNPDDSVRAASTSGGLFRVLAEYVISKGGLVYGAAFSEDFSQVRHQVAETTAALDPLMKSKYVWSDPTDAYKQALENLKSGRLVLFTGTPCQIAAMKSLAKGCDENLLTMDIVCHGTPRPEIFTSYIHELEKTFGGKITRYEFRNKDWGWNFPRVVAEFTQGGGIA